MTEPVCTCNPMGGNTGVAPSVDGCALHDPKLVSEILAEEARQRDIDQQLEEVCAFTAGEILLIRGGFFKVHAHAGKRLYLDFQGFAKDVLKRPE